MDRSIFEMGTAQSDGSGKRPRPDEEEVDDGGTLQRRRFILEQDFAPRTNLNPDEVEEEWVPVSFEDSVQKRDFGKQQCWACLYGHLIEDQEKHPAHYGLFQLLSKYYGRMANDELFLSMHRYHERFIRQPMVDDGEDCPEWPVAVIKEHCLEHMNDPAIEFGEQLKAHKAIKRFLLDKVSIRNTSGEIKHDLKVVEKVLAVSKAIRDLHNCKPEKCLFHDRVLKIGTDE